MAEGSAVVRREELTRDDIIRATADLIARIGTRNVSMRRLAREFDVTATALYYHFKDKQELLEQTADWIITELSHASDDDAPWTERLRVLLVEQNRLLQRYPGLSRLLLEYRDSTAAMRWQEMFLRILLDAGFRGSAAVRAFGIIALHINPQFLLDDPGTASPSIATAQEPLKQRLRDRQREFPALIELAGELEAMSFDAMYEAGVDSLVRGLEAELAAQPAHKARRLRKPS